jgi:hypothetical protein
MYARIMCCSVQGIGMTRTALMEDCWSDPTGKSLQYTDLVSHQIIEHLLQTDEYSHGCFFCQDAIGVSQRIH